MKRLRSSLVILAFLLLILARASSQTPAPSAGQASEVRRDAHVIMISVDGLVPDYYTSPARLGLRVPNLVKMKLGGAYAHGVEGVYPSVTYPAHTSLVTGVRPAIHGIVHNRIFEAPTDPQTKAWYWFSNALKTETLWDAAKKAGLVTGSAGWPVTVGAGIDYNMPEIFDPGERPLTIKRTLEHTTPSLLSSIAGLQLGSDASTDGRRTAVSEHIIKTHKPNLMLIHLIDLDGAHHRYGARSPQALEVTEREDSYLGRIIEATRVAGILDRTTFFIVSDHGFADVTRKFEPGVVLVKEKLITLGPNGAPVDWKAAAWPAGGSCAIVLRDPGDKETAAKVAEVFERIAKENGGPVSRVLTPEQLTKLGAVPTAALMLDAAPGVTFGEELRGPAIHPAIDYRGTHGQLPSRADLRASLVVYGEGAKIGASMPLARMIDIAPTAASVLGLRLASAEGATIRELLKQTFILPPPPKSKGGEKPEKTTPRSGARE